MQLCEIAWIAWCRWKWSQPSGRYLHHHLPLVISSCLFHDQQIEMPNNNPTLKLAACLLKAAFCCKYSQSSGSKAPDCLRAILAMEFKLSFYPHQPLTCRESRHATISLSIFARKLDKIRRKIQEQFSTVENLRISGSADRFAGDVLSN